MNALILWIEIFCAAFFVHLVLWRLRRPRYQTKALLAIFFGALPVGFFLSFWSNPLNFLGYLQVTVVHTGATLAYIMFYSALEVDPPTVLIIRKILEGKAGGVSHEVLVSEFTDDVLVKPRLKDLVRDQFAIVKQDSYVLTSKGKRFISIMNLYYKLIRR